MDSSPQIAVAPQSPAAFLPAWRWWALVPLGLACAAVLEPCLLEHGAPLVSLVLYRGFSLVCHQRPERSFWIFGAEMAVCSRCLGIYLGAAVGLLFRPSRRIALRLLIAAAGLNLFDAMTELAGWHGNWLAIRFALGLLLGGTAALLISSSISAEWKPSPTLRGNRSAG